MVICNLPHANHTVWLCCTEHGEPYITVEADVPDGFSRKAKWGLTPEWRMARYWIGVLRSKRWEACKLKAVEKAAIEQAIELLGDKRNVKVAHAI